MTPSPYKMPEVCHGMDVVWYDEGNLNGPQPGKVLAFSDETIAVGVFNATGGYVTVREGVRHIDHPNKNLVDMREGGLWDYAPLTRLLLTIKAEWLPDFQLRTTHELRLEKAKEDKAAADAAKKSAK